MNNLNKTCEACGEPLKDSQYARKKLEGQSTTDVQEVLVCRNYPKCSKAEKEDK